MKIYKNALKVRIIEGKKKGNETLLPRIVNSATSMELTFNIERYTFPVRLCFAMTINKAQGQTFNKVAVVLEEPVFSHGQLYVAFSRVRRGDNLFIEITNTSTQGLAKDGNVYTKNIVYYDVLE